jgi:hypothetical protein
MTSHDQGYADAASHDGPMPGRNHDSAYRIGYLKRIATDQGNARAIALLNRLMKLTTKLDKGGL